MQSIGLAFLNRGKRVNYTRTAWPVYTNLFFDKKKNRKLVNIRPSFLFYGIIVFFRIRIRMVYFHCDWLQLHLRKIIN